jgi:hypothetical protein
VLQKPFRQRGSNENNSFVAVRNLKTKVMMTSTGKNIDLGQITFAVFFMIERLAIG